MAQDKIARMGAEHRTNLVAYLDGELDEGAAHEVEQVLASSPVARHEVEMLARTWDMLNMLPTQRATSTFSQHTMQKLQQADLKPPPITERPWFRSLRRSIVLAVWCVGLAGAVAVGYQLTSAWIPNEMTELVDNLHAVQNLDGYQAAEKLEFLQKLKDDKETLDRLTERVKLWKEHSHSTSSNRPKPNDQTP